MSFAGSSRTGIQARLDALRTEYGAFEVRDHTVEVNRRLLADTINIQERDSLGGARVVVEHDGDYLLVKTAEDTAWDAPGGDRDPGESHVETARRCIHETTGVECAITGVELAHRYEFTLVEDSIGVTGLWVVFRGMVTDTALDVSDDVHEAQWFSTPPRGIAADVAECVDNYGDDR